MIQALPTISQRYVVQDMLGEGGMGVVYRAYDRLTRQVVALKRIRLSAESGGTVSETPKGDEALLRIAAEFHTMVGLSHPHIIRVLSYGFAAEGGRTRSPYFTMELVDGARSILDYAADQDEEQRLRVLLEMLEALEYLHRRGIVHRDLKPGNVLVDRTGRVKVMDFGLAMNTRSTQGDLGQMVVGTMAYMAPEVLMGERASAAADLYSVGVMAYELLAGQHPYYTSNISVLIMNILHHQPNIAALPPAVGSVIGRLLAKTPQDRYYSAREVIEALCIALGRPLPQEDEALRESYLQAARFVGRRSELRQLRDALKRLVEDNTSGLWLVGGASGVGKSRLLDELRTRALVAGATVMRGWTEEGISQPYFLWRNPVSRLALYVDINDLEAGVLMEIVPDIDRLLGRAIPPVPPLENPAKRRRLEQTLIALLRRQAEPMVLLLDDLQWAGEGLDLLRAVIHVLDSLLLLVVGGYRDDEAPSLPDPFLKSYPAAHVIHLSRLDDEAIAELSEAIAGEAGRQADVLALLRRESEGNAFFLIETMRALAQEAGGLNEIGKHILPERVFTSGVQSVILRRLQVLPLDDHPLLRLAAVIGRTIDLRLLRALDDETDYDAWLRRCEAASILTVGQYDEWTFVHDNYREGIVRDLAPDERPRLHRLAAETIEEVYGQDVHYAAALADHWQAAGEPRHELRYLLLAVEDALNNSANYARTLRLLQRALVLTETLDGHDHDQMRLYAHKGAIRLRLGDPATARDRFTHSLSLAVVLGDEAGRAAALLGISQTHFQQGSFSEAASLAHTCLALFRENQDTAREAQSLVLLGGVAHHQGDYTTARARYEEGLRLYQQMNALSGVANTLLSLSTTAMAQGDFAAAQANSQHSLNLYKRLNDQSGLGYSLGNLGMAAYHLGQYTEAEAYLSQQLEIMRDLGDQQGYAQSLGSLALIAHLRDDTHAAERYLRENLDICRRIQDRRGSAEAAHRLGEVLYSQREYAEALVNIEESLLLYEALDNPEGISGALITRSFIFFILGDAEAARRDLRTALEYAAAINAAPRILEAVVGYARLYLADGDAQQSAELAGQANRHARMSARLYDLHVAPLLEDLKHALSAEFLEKSLKRGKALDLNALAWALLQVG